MSVDTTNKDTGSTKRAAEEEEPTESHHKYVHVSFLNFWGA